MNLNIKPLIQKANTVYGNKLVFRDTTENDADFILGLRTHSQKSRYISQTSNDIKDQRQWLRNYQQSDDQAYFIVSSLSGDALGTVRLYDALENSFCWGSWIMRDGAPHFAAIESALMVYSYAIDYLGFSSARIDVRVGNKRQWQFHERFGSKRISETSQTYFYEIHLDEIILARKKYAKYLPQNVKVIQ
jgi:hypothetical protein